MLAEVERLEKAMQELLAMLDNPQTEGVEAAWQRCGHAQGELQVLLAKSASLDSDQTAELRRGLERLVRLNAITRQAVQHTQDGLARDLAKTKRESTTVKAYVRGTSGLGESCDLAG